MRGYRKMRSDKNSDNIHKKLIGGHFPWNKELCP